MRKSSDKGRSIVIAFLAGALPCIALLGCREGDDGHHDSDLPQSCEAIADACHHIDIHGGTDEASECHAVSHRANESECASKRDACVEACTHGHDHGGASGASG